MEIHFYRKLESNTVLYSICLWTILYMPGYYCYDNGKWKSGIVGCRTYSASRFCFGLGEGLEKVGIFQYETNSNFSKQKVTSYLEYSDLVRNKNIDFAFMYCTHCFKGLMMSIMVITLNSARSWLQALAHSFYLYTG